MCGIPRGPLGDDRDAPVAATLGNVLASSGPDVVAFRVDVGLRDAVVRQVSAA
jgi:hypothetical protein